MGNNDTKLTPTNILNRSYDPTFDVVTTELLGYNADSNSLKRVAVDADGNFNISATVSGADGAILDGVSGAIKATVKDLTNSNPLTVAITDGNGDQITSFGGGTQYTEGDTDATITGTAALVEGAANTLAPMSQPLTDTQLRATAVPVSGTVGVTGVATATIQTDGSQKSQIVDAGGEAVTVTGGKLDVNATVDTTGLALEAGNLASIKAKTDNIPALGQALAAASVPVILPAATITTLTPPAAITGFGTAANQTTIIGHLDGVEGLLTTIDADTGSIDSKTPALGQALAAASVPVVLTAAQITTLTPPAQGLTDAQLRATAVPVSGSLTVDLGANNDVTVTSGTITANLGAVDNAVLDDIASDTEAIKTSLAGTLTVTGGGGGTEYTEDAAAAANPVGSALMLVREDGRAGSLTTADGDNVALRGNNKGEAYVKDTDAAALLTTIDADTSNLSTKIDALAGAVAGTEMQVDVLTMPSVAVTGTFWQATQPVSGTVTATGPLTDTQLRATAVPISVATIPSHAVTNAGTFAVQNTAATPAGTNNIGDVDVLSSALPTGASTSAKQDTGNTSVASIDTKTPALGQALAAASVPVILPSATITTLTPPAAITGFATSAKQDTLLTELQLKADLTETQPVSLASVPSHAVTNVGTFAVQNTAATPAGTNNIGDVDVLTLPVAFNTGTRSATTQRVTIATDDSVPVTGTFYQATQPVSIASVPSHAVTNAGTFAVQVTSAPTTAVTGTFYQATQPVSVAATLATAEVAPTTVLHGKTTVTTAGTRVVLAASTACKSVTVKALAANTGVIYVGSTTVASTNGFALAAGETVSLDIANLTTVNIDSSVDGEGVTYLGVN